MHRRTLGSRQARILQAIMAASRARIWVATPPLVWASTEGGDVFRPASAKVVRRIGPRHVLVIITRLHMMCCCCPLEVDAGMSLLMPLIPVDRGRKRTLSTYSFPPFRVSSSWNRGYFLACPRVFAFIDYDFIRLAIWFLSRDGVRV